jgi:hypothetical protein
MKNDVLIQKTQAYLQEQFKNESSGHDWWQFYSEWTINEQILTFK